MNKIKIILISIASIAMISGCTSTPKTVIAPFDKSKTVEKPYDEVWSSLVRFLSTNDIAIATIEKDSGLIALKGENLSPDLIRKYCVVETYFMNTLESGFASGSVTVIDDDGFVTVNTNMRFKFTQVNGMTSPPSYKTLNCNSTGTLETSILSSFL
jgi:hypothetical protein